MKNPKVLVVDDDRLILETTAIMLESRFTVLKALNAEDAWEIFLRESPNCVVSDVVMEGRSGIDLLRRIRDGGFDTPVIVMTGRGSLEYAEQCANLRTSGYIKKPVSIDELLATVEKALGKRLDKNSSFLHSKITAPVLYGVQPRPRLFSLLDKEINKPVTWVSAPGGSGKTTLVKSWLDSRAGAAGLPLIWYSVDEGDSDLSTFFYYLGAAARRVLPGHEEPLPLLTPEYLQSVPVFTRRFFDEIFRRLRAKASSVAGRGFIVLDNFQDAPPDSRFQETIAHALAVIPEGIKVIIISREEPPVGFMRFRVNSKMNHVGWDDVRFMPEEGEAFISIQSGKDVPIETVREIYRRADGWAAGMLLMAEDVSKDPAALSEGRRHGMEEIFKYFAGEVLEKADDGARRFLIKTAFLKEITPAAAERLAGVDGAIEILDGLRRKNFFVEKRGETYRYHPLFCEFLLNAAYDSFSRAEVSAIRRDAAEVLVDSGRYEDAASLFRDAGEWEGVTRIILSNAQSLISQGRFKTIEEWLSWLPEAVVETTPWLLYWAGASRIAFDPKGARDCFERAYSLFKKGDDVQPLFMLWPLIIDTFMYAWDDFKRMDIWIREMEDLLARHPEFPSREIEARVITGMMRALGHGHPEHPELPLWADKAREFFMLEDDIKRRIIMGNHLMSYYSHTGKLSQARSVVNILSPVAWTLGDPLLSQCWILMETMYLWLAADWENCKRSLEEDLRRAEETGIHIFDVPLLGQGVWGGTSLGDLKTAESCIRKMEVINSPRPGDKAMYHVTKAMVYWHGNDSNNAVEHALLSVHICEDMGWTASYLICLSVLAAIYFSCGRHIDGDAAADRVMELGRHIPDKCFMMSFCRAYSAFERGKEEDGIKFLREGLAAGAGAGILNTLVWRNEQVAFLCAKALEHGIETDYVNRLVAKRGLVLPKSSLHPVLVRVRAWIGENLSADFTLPEAAKANGTSVSHLSRLYKEQLGISFTDDVNRMRVERAKELLRTSDDSVDHIRETVGYESSQSFFRNFKKVAGMTPREYRCSRRETR